jgi:hypothetical protein
MGSSKGELVTLRRQLTIMGVDFADSRGRGLDASVTRSARIITGLSLVAGSNHSSMSSGICPDATAHRIEAWVASWMGALPMHAGPHKHMTRTKVNRPCPHPFGRSSSASAGICRCRLSRSPRLLAPALRATAGICKEPETPARVPTPHWPARVDHQPPRYRRALLRCAAPPSLMASLPCVL